MSENLHIEFKLNRVREKLNADKIQLWMPPYYIEGCGQSESELENLAELFSRDLNIPAATIACALSELQMTAVEKLKSRKVFEETGLAVVKVKTPNNVVLSVELRLDAPGSDLFQKVADRLAINIDRIKLIASGKLIDAKETLTAQGIKNGQKMLAIILELDRSEIREKESVHERLRKIKKDVAVLTENHDYMHMEDQHGNAVHLPPEERQSIMMALAIHEKGKAALKRNRFNEALYLLLEADKYYYHCSSDLLRTVDNYARLYLDIVWCYVKLKSADHLSDAARRLEVCEKKMTFNYGPEMSRVAAIKGELSVERCLLMRLHLMQAIVLYHQDNVSEAARAKFATVELELAALRVDDQKVIALVEMGFSDTEARIGLRESGGDPDGAVAHIYAKRQAKKEARATGAKERVIAERCEATDTNKKKKKDRSGASGSREDVWVNPKTLITLKDMGFDLKLAKAALKSTDNDLEQALELLQDPLRLRAVQETVVASGSATKNPLNKRLLHTVVKVPGITPDFATKFYLAVNRLPFPQGGYIVAQISANGGRSTTLDTLKGIYESLSSSSSGNATAAEATASGPSTSTGISVAEQEEQILKEVLKIREELSAFGRFSEDITNEDDEFLDMSLEHEELLLAQYKRVLGL